MFFRLSQWMVSVASVLQTWREQLTDEDLVVKVQAGGEHARDAFEILVERHQSWLVKFIKHLTSSRVDAEDLAQNVMVRAYLALPKFRRDASFKTWLRVIATRETYNHFRKNRIVVDDEVDVQSDVRSKSPSSQGSYDIREALHVALLKVPYAYREILVLRYVEEMELQEIAETLGLGQSATKMRLKRARDIFKDVYQGTTAA